MSLKSLSSDVYEQLDAKLDAAVEVKQIKTWLMSVGVSATVSEIREYAAGRHQNIAEPAPERQQAAFSTPEAYIAIQGLSAADRQARLLQRMLQLTDMAWRDFESSGNLKTAEFLQRQIPAASRLLVEQAPVEEIKTEQSLFEDFRQDGSAYVPVDTETALRTIYETTKTINETDLS